MSKLLKKSIEILFLKLKTLFTKRANLFIYNNLQLVHP